MQQIEIFKLIEYELEEEKVAASFILQGLLDNINYCIKLLFKSI